MDCQTLARHSSWSTEAQRDSCLLGLGGWDKDELVSKDLLIQPCSSSEATDQGVEPHADWQNNSHMEGTPRESLPALWSSRSSHFNS